VPCPKNKAPSSTEAGENPNIELLLGSPITSSTEKFNIGRNEVRGYTMNHTVQFYGRDNWLNDGSKPNQAALALTDWELPFDWRGNIVVMHYAGLIDKKVKPPELVIGDISIPMPTIGGEVEPFKEFQDVTMADLRIAVDYLMSYGVGIQRGMEHQSLYSPNSQSSDGPLSELQKQFEKNMGLGESEKKSKRVKGVMIRCEGDIGLQIGKSGKWERYSEVDVTMDHAVWKECPTEASKVMGLPILVHKLPPNPAWDKNNHTRFDNQPATFLNLTVDPKEETMWGFAPLEWQREVGSVLLVRKDAKDISREQAWALAEYMQFRVSDSFEAAMESGEEKQRRAAVLKMLNWKRFDTWLEHFKVEMTAADYKSWKDVRSPFGTKVGYNGQPL
jgi:hypothetical protein